VEKLLFLKYSFLSEAPWRCITLPLPMSELGDLRELPRFHWETDMSPGHSPNTFWEATFPSFPQLLCFFYRKPGCVCREGAVVYSSRNPGGTGLGTEESIWSPEGIQL